MKTFSRETFGLHPWFVTGLAQGQGIFTYSRTGGNLNLFFALNAAAAERDLLRRIREFFGGAGKIYPVKAPRAGASGRSAEPAARYRVSRINDLQRVVEHFDAFPLRGAKRRRYEVWREMALHKRRRFRKPDPDRLEALARRLSAASLRGGPGER